jgi:DUF1680 family protein
MVFDWAMGHVASSFGWISERAHESAGGCETCCLADALDLATTLAASGHPEYWDLAERIARNHLLQSQCPETGGFSGHTMPNDYCWIHPSTGQPEHHVGGCCSPAGVRALWLAWDSIASRRGEETLVNLPLTRPSPIADVASSLPREGRVEVTLREAGNLLLRLPPWVERQQVRLMAAGASRPPVWSGPHVRVDGLKAGDATVVTLPVREERREESFMGFSFTVAWRGSTVTAVEPSGTVEPLYRTST